MQLSTQVLAISTHWWLSLRLHCSTAEKATQHIKLSLISVQCVDMHSHSECYGSQRNKRTLLECKMHMHMNICAAILSECSISYKHSSGRPLHTSRPMVTLTAAEQTIL